MKKLLFVILACISLFSITSCSSSDDCEGDPQTGNVENQFDNMVGSNNLNREKIVVISDIHLGVDLSFSETVKHLSRIEDFVNEVGNSKTVKELIINGDMLDEWYIPTRTDTYAGGTQEDFVKRIAKSNKAVIDAFNKVIKEGKVKVTYVPGNHDLLIDANKVEAIMPGINQARDTDRSLIGTYHPDGYPQIAIEHGHRYDFFCNLDPFDNQDIAPGSVLPPGYFFARIAANSFVNQVPKSEATKVADLQITPTNLSQKALYLYHYGWKSCLNDLIWVNDNFNDKIFKTNIDGYTGTLSMNDILPYNDNGTINVKLYKNAFTQENWEKRLAYNNAPVMTNVADAVIGSLLTSFIDNQSNVQYFQNSKSNVRIVIFGHTHIPMIKSFTNVKNEACVYANTGTWIDEKIRDIDAAAGKVVDQDTVNMNFVVVMPHKNDQSEINVGLYKYKRGKHVLVENQNIK